MNARTRQIGADNQHTSRAGSGRPLFAQPLNVSKSSAAFQPYMSHNVRGWISRPTAWGLAAITCGVLLAFARPNNAQNVPANGGSASVAHTSVSAHNSRSVQVAQARPTAPTVEVQKDEEESSRRSVDFYTQSVRGNMFSAPQPPAPKAVKVVVPKVVVVKPTPPPVVPVAPVNPFATWSYTGTITMGEEKTALLENSTNKEGQYVKAGEMFMGARVTSITDQMITLQSGVKPYSMAKSDAITVTPLDRSAIPTQAGQAPQAGQPAQQAQAQPQTFDPSQVNRWRGGGGGQTFTLPNGRTMNAQQFQRRAGRMNQNFNQ